MSAFVKITILQYINIAVIVLLINFNGRIISDNFKVEAYVFNGQYSDFTSDWYRDIGATLCVTLFLQTFTQHGSKIFWPVVSCLLRCWDRDCSKSMLKEDGDVNTKQTSQSKLEDVYTGREIQTAHVYASYFTILWSVLTYSSGMPILYPIAFVNYFILFWVNKALLLKHFRKTSTFNQDLTNYTIFFFKVGIVLHVLMAALIYTNT